MVGISDVFNLLMIEVILLIVNVNVNVIVRKLEFFSGLSVLVLFLIFMKLLNEGMSCWFFLWYGFYILNGVMS